MKTEACKNKEVVIKAMRTVAKKSSISSKEIKTRITKKSMILKKSETNNKFHGDDSQSEATQSVMLKSKLFP